MPAAPTSAVLGLKSEQLTFRRLGTADVDAFHLLITDPHIRRFMMDGQTMVREWTQRAVTASDDLFETRGIGLWLVFEHVDTQHPVGFCGFRVSDALGDKPQLLYAFRSGTPAKGSQRRWRTPWWSTSGGGWVRRDLRGGRSAEQRVDPGARKGRLPERRSGTGGLRAHVLVHVARRPLTRRSRLIGPRDPSGVPILLAALIGQPSCRRFVMGEDQEQPKTVDFTLDPRSPSKRPEQLAALLE